MADPTCSDCGGTKGHIYVDGIDYGWFCESCQADHLPDGYTAVYEDGRNNQLTIDDFLGEAS